MIIIMGVAGAGKSVQGRWIADEIGLPWLSTGEFLRMLVTGERRKEMLAGKLLDDSEMIGLADKIFHMIDMSQEFVLDGFPRTIAQADWLIAQHKAGLINISRVIHIEASEEVVVRRLLQRGRQDDTKEAISARFKEYSAVTLPIIKDFEQKQIVVHHINGEGTPEEVHSLIKDTLQI
jgi:adenylate kinase